MLVKNNVSTNKETRKNKKQEKNNTCIKLKI